MLNFTRFVAVLIGLAATSYAAAEAPIWFLKQIYTNANGSVQFVVYSTEESGQQFLAGQLLVATGRVTSEGPLGVGTVTTSHTFTFPNDLPGDSANRTLLIATQGFADLHVLEPDYVVPNRFFPVQGGAISLAGDAEDIYGAPPTDGVRSLNDADAATPGEEWVVNVAVATNFGGGRYTFTGWHGWRLREIYSNAGGSVQFAVLSAFESGHQFLAGSRLYAVNFLYDINYFTFPMNLPGDSAHRSLLIATQGFADLRVLRPDYVVPNRFFFTALGNVTLASLPFFTRPMYLRLPTDGINAMWMGPSASAVPRGIDLVGQSVDTAVATNFAGEQYTFGRTTIRTPTKPTPTIPTPRVRCLPGRCN